MKLARVEDRQIEPAADTHLRRRRKISLMQSGCRCGVPTARRRSRRPQTPFEQSGFGRRLSCRRHLGVEIPLTSVRLSFHECSQFGPLDLLPVFQDRDGVSPVILELKNPYLGKGCRCDALLALVRFARPIDLAPHQGLLAWLDTGGRTRRQVHPQRHLRLITARANYAGGSSCTRLDKRTIRSRHPCGSDYLMNDR